MQYPQWDNFARRLRTRTSPNFPSASAQVPRSSGITLLELLIGISIVAILAATALPSFTHWQAKAAANATTHVLFQQLQATREFAITAGTAVSLCGANAQGNCSLNNITELHIFIDSNNNKLKDPQETLLAHTALPPGGRLSLNAHKVIRMKADGSSNTPASFIYCPRTPNLSLIRKVTISFTGRTYVASMPATPNDNPCPHS